MTADYTPSTDEITRYYIDGSRDWFPGLTASERSERFYRWLVEVRREAAEKAWDEGFRTSERIFEELWDLTTPDDARTQADNPYRKEADRDR